MSISEINSSQKEHPNNIESVLSKPSFKNFFAQHHLNNYNLIGYQKYLKNKQEGRWFVYSWAALILQPFFFIFYKMYLMGFIYSLLFGLFFGLNVFYGIAFILVFPFFAFRLYEFNADLIFIKSLKKYNNFEKKYSNNIQAQENIKLELEKLENNKKISERKKAKKKESILRSLRWNYKLLSPYTYFFDKIKPLSTVLFIPVSFFIFTLYSLFAFVLFTMNDPIGMKIKDMVVSELTVNSKNKLSEKEKEQLNSIILFNDLGTMSYQFHDRYFNDSMLEEKKMLPDPAFLNYMKNITTGNNSQEKSSTNKNQ